MKRQNKPVITVMMIALFCAICLTTYPVQAAWESGSGGYRHANLCDDGSTDSTNTSYNMTAEVLAPAYWGLDRATWNVSIVFAVTNQTAHTNTTKWSVSYLIDDGTTPTTKWLENKTFNYDGATHYLEFTSSVFAENTSAALTITLYKNYHNASLTNQTDQWTSTMNIVNATVSGLIAYWTPILIEVIISLAILGMVAEITKKFTKN